jgi:type IV pilus assembly protein PilB
MLCHYFEVIKISRDVEKLIVRNSTAADIQDQAIKEGLITMKQDGYLKALDGITTLEEVLRVAQT